MPIKNIIVHKQKIPEYNNLILKTTTCNNQIALPSGIPSPTFWYKADAPTASINTTGSNTVSGTDYTSLYDFGSYYSTWTGLTGVDLSQKSASYDWLQTSNIQQNGLTTISSDDVAPAHNNYDIRTGQSPNYGIAGKGTVIVAWRSGVSLSNLDFTARNAFSLATGFFHRGSGTDITTIYGDNQSYQFATQPLTNNIRVVSITASGNPITYTQNGVSGATTSYNTIANVGTLYMVNIETTGNSDQLFFEALYWQTPLSLQQCNDVQDYLQKKWCIDF